MKKEPMRLYQVHMPVPMHEKGQAKADALGLSFAAYIRTLVAKDLANSKEVQ